MRCLPSTQSFLRQQKWYVRAVATAVGLPIGAAAWAGSITRTNAYEYDPVTGYLTAEVSEPDTPQLSVRTAYTLDQFGNRLTETISSPATGLAAVPTRTVSAITYDATAKPTSAANALGQVANVGVDASLQLTYVLNPIGQYTSFEYDNFKRKTAEYYPDGSNVRYDYVLCGGAVTCADNVKFYVRATPQTFDGTQFVQSGPAVTTYSDSLSRTVRTETVGFDGVTLVTQDTEYDGLGRVLRVSKPYYPNATKQWTTYSYDAIGRVVAVTAPDNSLVTTTYNGLGTTVTNALNQTQTTLRNGKGQTVQITDSQGNTLSFQYDAQGNLTQTTDPKANTVKMTYDLLGHKTSEFDRDLYLRSYVYDALGQLVQQTDMKGNVTTFAYDLLGRMVKRTEADLVSSWNYDTCVMGAGQLCSETADNGYSINNSYDVMGRLSQSTTHIDTDYTIGNTYDVNGRIATKIYPTGLTLKYIYGALGFLTEIRDNASNALYWQANSRDAEGDLLQQTYGNGVVTQRDLDPATGRTRHIYAGAGNAVQNLSFTYDTGGNMLTRNDANQNLTESFLYDYLNRLTSNTVNSSGTGIVTQSYSYDNIGDMISRSDVGTYQYLTPELPHAVRVIRQANGYWRGYLYGANGNSDYVQQHDAANKVIASQGRKITYTSFNMPLTLANSAVPTPSTATWSFVYGAEHQRIKQIAPGGTTIYVNPDNSGGLLYEKYMKTDGSVEHTHYITADGDVVAMVKQNASGTSVDYLHRDQLGSTTAVTDSNGVVIERFAYEPFGKRRSLAGALDTNGTLAGATTARGFTNHEHIDGMGLINMNGRLYDPAIGRFVSPDPAVPYPTDLQSYNRYSYVRNNPLIATDPSGFIDCTMGPNPREDGYKYAQCMNEKAREAYNNGLLQAQNQTGTPIVPVNGQKLGSYVDPYDGSVHVNGYVDLGGSMNGTPPFSAPPGGSGSGGSGGGKCATAECAAGVLPNKPSVLETKSKAQECKENYIKNAYNGFVADHYAEFSVFSYLPTNKNFLGAVLLTAAGGTLKKLMLDGASGLVSYTSGSAAYGAATYTGGVAVIATLASGFTAFASTVDLKASLACKSFNNW